MYSDTVTLFNRKPGETGDTWYPTVLRNVHLNRDNASIRAKYGEGNNHRVLLHVPYVRADARRGIAGKDWLPPKAWQAQDTPETSLTFAAGNAFDFFWVGEWTGAAPGTDADYLSDGGFYGYMNRVHDDVYAVTAVSGPFDVIPHFEVVGQ
jgi:hypothetical protein